MALNRYAYASNSPLMYTDPTGHFISGPMGCLCAFGGKGPPPTLYIDLEYVIDRLQKIVGMRIPSNVCYTVECINSVEQWIRETPWAYGTLVRLGEDVAAWNGGWHSSQRAMFGLNKPVTWQCGDKCSAAWNYAGGGSSCSLQQQMLEGCSYIVSPAEGLSGMSDCSKALLVFAAEQVVTGALSFGVGKVFEAGYRAGKIGHTTYRVVEGTRRGVEVADFIHSATGLGACF